MGITVGVMKESATAELRVAVVPEVVPRLTQAGLTVLVESAAGSGAWFPDSAFRQAGATVVDAAELDQRSDILVCVQPPERKRLAGFRAGQVLVGLLNAAGDPDLVEACRKVGVAAVSLELLPRTLSRAQAMDALTSQANIAGYKAVVVAADAYGRYFPMLMTAAGTARPAQILVLGVGVAGLSALGTARRLGAQVTGYDIRPETRDEVVSVGAKFLELSGVAEGGGVGGYARALSDEERQAQQEALQQRIGDFDVLITTAQVPGRKPPQLVTREAVKSMRPGSVVVDLAAGPLGGNVEGSVAGERVVVDEGVTVIGAGNLASAMAPGASTAYARNIAAVLAHLVHDDQIVLDDTDELTKAIAVTGRGGAA